MAIKILLGTTNKEKIEEYKYLFEYYGLSEHGYVLDIVDNLIDVDETGNTCAENAKLKSCEYAKHTGQIVLADDTGIFINVLKGAPGVNSKRYAGASTVEASVRNVIYDIINGKSVKCKVADTYNAKYVTAICLSIPSAFGIVNIEYQYSSVGTFKLVASGEYSPILYDRHFMHGQSNLTIAEDSDYMKYTARSNAFGMLAEFLKGNFPQL